MEWKCGPSEQSSSLPQLQVLLHVSFSNTVELVSRNFRPLLCIIGTGRLKGECPNFEQTRIVQIQLNGLATSESLERGSLPRETRL